MSDTAHSAAHPTVDELSDLRENLLTGDAEHEVSAHVSGCADCTAEVAALDEVAAVLADVGSMAEAMPSDVAERLDGAIARASLERSAGVPSLDSRREARGGSLATRSFKWLGAAAAVVVIGAAGVGIFQGQGSQSDDDAGAATAGLNRGGAAEDSDGGDGAAADRPQSSSPESARLAPQRVSPKTLRSYAATFASAPVGTASHLRDEVGDFLKVCARPPTRSVDSVAAVKWRGKLAFVVLDREAREATVYGCEAPPERLYSTPY